VIALHNIVSFRVRGAKMALEMDIVHKPFVHSTKTLLRSPFSVSFFIARCLSQPDQPFELQHNIIQTCKKVYAHIISYGPERALMSFRVEQEKLEKMQRGTHGAKNGLFILRIHTLSGILAQGIQGFTMGANE